MGRSAAWREGETEARREDVAHRQGVGEPGFPPFKIKTNTDEQGKRSRRGLRCRVGACPRGIKSSPLGKLAPAVPRGRDDAGDRRGWRVPQPARCRGRRSATPRRSRRLEVAVPARICESKQEGERGAAHRIYSGFGEVTYCGFSEVGTGVF